jgi:hypothetical protein
MKVQTFWNRIREINKHIEWLPGSEPVLTDDQLQQSFYDAMPETWKVPETWKDRYVDSGSVFEDSTFAEVVQYFRRQESNANKKQQVNEKFQKRKSRGHGHQNGPSKYEKSKSSNTTDSEDEKSDEEDNNKKKPSVNPLHKRSHISDDTPCPTIHPGAGHKWSQCRSNAYNKDRLNYKKAKPNNDNPPPASEAKGSMAEVHAIAYDDPKDILYSQVSY